MAKRAAKARSKVKPKVKAKAKTRPKAKASATAAGIDVALLDKRRRIKIGGRMFFGLKASNASELNPCAGKPDGTYCGPGCVCRGGQCYYGV